MLLRILCFSNISQLMHFQDKHVFLDESEQKPDPALEKKREEEHEAAIKMQRAYRHHLARMKAARKCQGLSADTLEWARSYKGWCSI